MPLTRYNASFRFAHNATFFQWFSVFLFVLLNWRNFCEMVSKTRRLDTLIHIPINLDPKYTIYAHGGKTRLSIDQSGKISWWSSDERLHLRLHSIPFFCTGKLNWMINRVLCIWARKQFLDHPTGKIPL